MAKLPAARWWTVRPAANRKPTTYRCPICGHHLAALSEHLLIAPEGDTWRRRHAHIACVMKARRKGDLVLEEEWRRQARAQAKAGAAGQSRSRRLLSRLLRVHR